MVLCAGPLLTLAGALRRARLQGAFEYGRIAAALGRGFEERWVESATAVDAEALGAPDFSATTDLFSVAANVRKMRIVPLDIAGVLSLVAATLLPFIRDNKIKALAVTSPHRGIRPDHNPAAAIINPVAIPRSPASAGSESLLS